jgi:hypothetical protein
LRLWKTHPNPLQGNEKSNSLFSFLILRASVPFSRWDRDSGAPGCAARVSGTGCTIYIIAAIFEMMSAPDAVTSIPVHQSTLRALRGAKMADQTWDEFLLALADDYIAPSLKAELDRRLKTEKVIPGSEIKAEYTEWRKRRGLS